MTLTEFDKEMRLLGFFEHGGGWRSYRKLEELNVVYYRYNDDLDMYSMVVKDYVDGVYSELCEVTFDYGVILGCIKQNMGL